MRRVLRSAAAEADLRAIYRYIAADNPDAAEATARRLVATTERLGEHSHLGAARPELGEGIRSIVNDRYLILYRIEKAAVEVVRIVHSARDLGGLDLG